MKVVDMAVREVESVAAEASVKDCALVMRRKHVGSLVVVDGNNVPVGMITDRDLAIEVLAQGLNPDALTVGDVMTTPVAVAQEEENVIDALARLRERGVRRLPVVDAAGKLTGIVTSSNLLEELSMELDSLVRAIKASHTRETETRP
ncbi:MAG: CBS domain-containing protein [Burkholderiaceae bacterium]